MDRSEIPYDTRHLEVLSGASKLIFEHMVCPCKPGTYLASRLALSPNRTNRASTCASSARSTIRCLQNGLLEYGALGTNRAPILHRNQHYLQTNQDEDTYDTWHLGVSSDASKLISKHMVHSMQTMHLSCIKISNTSKQTEPKLPLEPLQLGVLSGASKLNSKHMIRSMQNRAILHQD